MKIPESIRIGSVNYKVEMTNQLLTLNNKEVVGMIDYMNHIIKVRTDCHDIQGQQQTFLHEVVHGIFNERKIENDNDENEERIVDDISIALHQIIRDNPDVFNSSDNNTSEKFSIRNIYGDKIVDDFSKKSYL